MRRMALGLTFKCDGTGDGQLNLRATTDTAPQPQAGANSFRSLAHSGQPPMSFAARLEHLRVNSTAIVAHQDSEILACVFYFDFHSVRFGMQEGIYDGLEADTVDLVLNQRAYRTRRALGDDA